MAGFSLSPGRARAARFATALALTLACAGVLGAASAFALSPTTVDLTCGPQEPVVGSEGSCEVTVSSPEAPTGNVRFERIGFANLGGAKCTPIRVSEQESRCTLRFKATAPGRLVIGAGYEDSTHEFARDLAVLEVRAGGSIAVDCSPELGFPGELSTCEAFVPNTPGVTVSPTGTLHFRAEAQGSTPEEPGLREPECTLEATPAGASCAVTFVPLFSNVDAISAEYAGDASHPAQFGSVIYLVFNQHETAVSASCSPAPSTLAPTTCTATVVNLTPTGGAPTGFVGFEDEIHFEDLPFPFATCDLKPVGDPKANESSCQVKYQPTREGRQTLQVRYEGDLTFERTRSLLQIEVIDPRTTATSLTCKPSRGTFAGVCLASVTDTSAKPVPLSGTIRISGPTTVKFSSPTCTLLAGQSGCSFPYSMATIGSATVTAEYLGDNKGHLPSSGTAVASKVP